MEAIAPVEAERGGLIKVAFSVDPGDGTGKANKARSRRPARNRPVLAAGLATLALFLAAQLLLPEDWRETFRETALDMVLAIDHRLEPKALDKAAANPVVVDVDRRSLAEVGAWPWPRERMAGLVAVVTSAKPAVVAFDIHCDPVDASSFGRLPAIGDGV